MYVTVRQHVYAEIEGAPMKLYKLTDERGRTRNNTHWGEGITHQAAGSAECLCTSSYIHAYEHPIVAVLMNPIHKNLDPHTMRLWEADGDIALRDGPLKCGCKSLTTIREIPVPVITSEQRITIAIHSTRTVCTDICWNRWANAWLDGSDRSTEAARRAWRAAWATELTEMRWVVRAAAWTADAATELESKIALWTGAAIVGAVAGAKSVYSSLDIVTIIEEVMLETAPPVTE